MGHPRGVCVCVGGGPGIKVVASGLEHAGREATHCPRTPQDSAFLTPLSRGEAPGHLRATACRVPSPSPGRAQAALGLCTAGAMAGLPPVLGSLHGPRVSALAPRLPESG